MIHAVRRPPPPPSLGRHWLILPLLFVAFGLRMWNLYPTFFYGDDAEYATVAGYLANDPRDLRYPDIEGFGAQPFVSQPPLALYLMGWMGNLVGDAEGGAVMVSVVLGSATVGLVYVLGYLAHGRAAGAFGALFLAVQPFHVELSRKAYLDATFVFFMTLAMVCFGLWCKSRRTTWAVATGCAAAASCLSKLPGILVLVPLVLAVLWLLRKLWFLLYAAKNPRGEAGRRPPRPDPLKAATLRQEIARWCRQSAWATVPLVIGASLYLGLLFYLKSLKDLATKLGWQYTRVAEADQGVVAADRGWTFYFAHPSFGIPAQLGVLIFLLAIVGFVIAARRSRRLPRAAQTFHAAMFTWPITTALFFAFSARKEWFYILPVMPPMAMFAGIGAAAALGVIAARMAKSRPIGRRLPAVAAATAFLLAIVPTATPAFDSVNEVVLAEQPYGFGVKEAAYLVHGIDPDAAQVGTILGRFTLHFYNGQPAYHWYVDHDFIEDEIKAGRVRFIVLDTHLRIEWEEQWLKDLVIKYNGAVLREYESLPGKVKVVVYELHPATAPER